MMAGRLLFAWVLIGALLGVGAASAAVLVDVAPVEVAAAAGGESSVAVASQQAVFVSGLAVAGDEMVYDVDCAKYPNKCPKPPVEPPVDPAGTIVFNDDGVLLSCEMGNYLVSVSGTANVPAVTVEAFDGGEPGRATFTVTNGTYSGNVIVPAEPGADSGAMTAIVHTPEPDFMAIGPQDTFTYRPC